MKRLMPVALIPYTVMKPYDTECDRKYKGKW